MQLIIDNQTESLYNLINRNKHRYSKMLNHQEVRLLIESHGKQMSVFNKTVAPVALEYHPENILNFILEG